MTARLRPATAADTPEIRRIYAPFVENTVISFETEPPTEAEMETRTTTKTERYPWLVAENESVVGYANAGSHRSREAYRWSVGVSVYVDPDHHAGSPARSTARCSRSFENRDFSTPMRGSRSRTKRVRSFTSRWALNP